MIKTFRGLIADGGQDTINLHTNDGKTGYRIVKFQIMNPGAGAAASEMESTVKIYKVAQATVDGVVDFSDNTLLGAAQLGTRVDANYQAIANIIIFDREIFNQDIYVTHENLHGDAASSNYYIELEQISLDLNESTVATLQSIRNA